VITLNFNEKKRSMQDELLLFKSLSILAAWCN
jgi:hypothetical protein